MRISKRQIVLGVAASVALPRRLRAFGGGALSDPFAFVEYPSLAQHGRRNTDGLTQVPTAIGNPARTKNGITFGQSNICSPCGTAYVVTQAQNHMMNIYDGATYLTQEPMIGMNDSPVGNSGVNSRLGDSLIATGKCERSIIMPIAIAGTSSADWAPGGVLNARIVAACRRLASVGRIANYIVWHQGENESGLGGVSAAQYTANVQAVCQTFRNNGQSAPFYVCLATNLNGAYRAQTRLGQQNCVSASLNILQGPDTDTLGFSMRQSDGIHFNAAGMDAFASMLTEII